MAPAITPWKTARLIALDLEGSGAQDRDNEAILEIAVVPLTNGEPDMHASFCSLVNPSRRIRQGPWISPGLTNTVLATAPSLRDIEPQLADRLDGATIVGHNVAVDWRLLHRRCPTVQPAGLIDTLRLARHLRAGEKGRSLGTLVDKLGLRPKVDRLAASSQTHRALWDAVASGLLLAALIDEQPGEQSHEWLLAAAGVPIELEPEAPRLF